jgi:death-on-curing protein
MRYLALREILELHDKIIEVTGGARGIRDIRALKSAINQPASHLIKPIFTQTF